MNLERYFDYNATTPVDERVLDAMLPWFNQNFSNPSSFYRSAAESRAAIEEARAHVAALVGASPGEIVFTMGGTESDNLAILGIAEAAGDGEKHIITSAVEHPAVLNSVLMLKSRGLKVTVLPVDGKGYVDPGDLRRSLRPETILVSIMVANNEIGTLQPMDELAAVAREANVPFHTDAIQAAGKIPLNVRKTGIDLLSLSGHKMYGPKGVGALYRRKGLLLKPQIAGGGHESGLRSGTENVPGIVGLGRAARIAAEEMSGVERQVRPLRDRLLKGLEDRVPDIMVNGDPVNGLFNTVNVSFRHIEGESILAFLDQDEFSLSSGSACSSHSLDPSPVMMAIGRSHAEAHGSIRFSLGRFSTSAAVDALLEALPPVIARLRAMSPFGKEALKISQGE